METVIDKAGEEYWSKVWSNIDLQLPIDVNSDALNNHINQRFHKKFQEIFADKETQGKLFLEVGCGNSVWLPYFASQYGFNVNGLDYSEHGCEQARQILKRENVNGTVICGDLFNPPTDLIGKFDYVISLGVVEHFSNTTETITSLSNFLKPGGILITSIPNHTGLLGFLQKIFNRPVYDIHVILGKNDLNNAVLKSNLKLLNSQYLISISLNVNLEGKERPVKFYKMKKLICKFFSIVTTLLWWLEKRIGNFPEGKFFSAAIISVAQKK